MMILFMVVFVFVLSFGAIIAAIIVMVKNRKGYIEQEEVYVRGEVVKTDVNSLSMHLDNSKNYDYKSYFVEIRTDQNELIALNCNRKTYQALLPGFYGDIIYKGTRLVSFNRLAKHEETRLDIKNEEGYFFVKRNKKNNPVDFYCDAPNLGIKIPADDPEKLDVDEVVSYINRMLENKVENFFGLDNKKMVIQFFNDGDNDDILIDIPDMKRNGSYQATISGINKTKTIVRAYFYNEDVFKLAYFEFMQF